MRARECVFMGVHAPARETEGDNVQSTTSDLI